MKAITARVGLTLFLSHMAGASEEPFFARGEHRMEDAAIQLMFQDASNDSARAEPSTEVEGYGEAFGGCTDGKAHLEAQARAASVADAEGICESKVKRMSEWRVSSYCINVYDRMRGGARARATFRCDKSSG